MAKARRKKRGSRGFASKAQWRYFFARGRRDPRFARWAHKKAHATKGGPKVRYRRLPARKKVRKR